MQNQFTEYTGLDRQGSVQMSSAGLYELSTAQCDDHSLWLCNI